MAVTFRCFAQGADESVTSAKASIAAGDYGQAIILLTQLVSEYPEWEPGWVTLGKCYYVTRQFEAAEKAFQQGLALTPDDAEGIAFGGLSELELGEYDKALEALSRVVRLSSSLAPALMAHLRTERAFVLLKLGRFDEAERTLAQFTAEGEQPELLRALGLVTLRRAMFPAEVSAGDVALVEAAGRALYFQLSGLTDKAEAAYESLLRTYADVENVHYAYGYFVLGRDRRKAAQEFRTEMQRHPKNAMAESMLAYSVAAEDPVSAQRLAKEAAVDEPEQAVPQYVLGTVLLGVTPSDGVTALERAEKLDPDNLEYHVELVVAYTKVGRYHESKREESIALQLSSEPGF